jgi:hypothetical protein
MKVDYNAAVLKSRVRGLFDLGQFVASDCRPRSEYTPLTVLELAKPKSDQFYTLLLKTSIWGSGSSRIPPGDYFPEGSLRGVLYRDSSLMVEVVLTDNQWVSRRTVWVDSTNTVA